MTAAPRGPAPGRLSPEAVSGDHKPRVIPRVIEGQHDDYTLFYAGCVCGWVRESGNTQRENATRAARRHVTEAQS